MKFRLKGKRYFYWIGGIVLFALLWWWYSSHQNSSAADTLVVHPTTFAQEISISGTVQAAQNVDLGFAQSGRISGVYARVGDVVAAGATLAQTDNGDLRATLAQKQATLQVEQSNLASLKSGTRPEEIAVTQAQIESDKDALDQAETAIVNAIQNAYTQSDDAVHNKIDQFFNNPRSSSASLSFTTSNSQLQNTLVAERFTIEATLSVWQAQSNALVAGNDISKAKADAQTNLAQVTTLLSDGNAALNAAISTTQTSQTTLNGYITNIAIARTNVNAALSTLTSAITAQKSAAATLAKDKKTLALEQAGSTSDDIAAQQAQVDAAQADVESVQSQLGKTIVAAPFTGTVTRMDAKVGQVVSPTTPEISMISGGLFQIQTYIPEVEVTGLAVGNNATTTLDAYGSSTYFLAKVIAIDPAQTTVNGVSTYKTTLQFLRGDQRIKSGMTANVMITTKETPHALVVPQSAVFNKGSSQYIQLVREKKVIDIPIQVGGSSSIGNIEVITGLSDGDEVVLNPDTSR